MKKTIGEKLSKKVAMAITIAMSCAFLSVSTFAAPSVSVSADQSNPAVSDTVTISVKTSEPEDDSVAPQIQLTYDATILEYVGSDVECGGGGGSLSIPSTSASIQFKTLAQGSANIKVEAQLSEDGESPTVGSTTITVGGAQNANLSSDATLRALSVNPGTLSPNFSPAVTNYTIAVDASVENITVSGGVTDDNAQITAASGFKNLSEGENQAIITVTAENGSSLTYKFAIYRGGEVPESALEEETASEETQEPVETPATEEEDQANPNVSTGATTAGAGVGGFSGGAVTFSKNNVTYQVTQSFDTNLMPKGCTKTTISIQGQSVEGITFEPAGISAVYAISGSNGNGDFYIYNPTDNSYCLFAQIPMANDSFVIPLSNSQDVVGFYKTELPWNNNGLLAYQASESKAAEAKDFYLLYAVNENGDSGYYLYDAGMGTCQRYVVLQGGTSKNSASKNTTIIFGMLSIVIVGMLMVILNLVLRNKDLQKELTKKKRKDDAEDSDRVVLKKTAKNSQTVYPKTVKKSKPQPVEETEMEEESSHVTVKARKRVEKPVESVEELPKSENVAPEEVAEEGEQEVVKKTLTVEAVVDALTNGGAMTSAVQEDGLQDDAQAGGLSIEIKKEKEYVAPSEEEIEKQRAMELAKEEKKKAARKAALEKEIQKDEKARAKQAAAEKKAMEKLLAAEQKLASRQNETAKTSTADKPKTEKTSAATKPSAKKSAPSVSSNTARMKTFVKKEVTERGVTYTTGKIPIDLVKDAEGNTPISGQVPIYTLEKRTVTLTREPSPDDELDDDFEFEFINPKND